MLNPGEGDAVMASIGRSVFNGVFAAGNMLGLGIPGAVVGGALGAITIFGAGSPWKGGSRPDTHQN